MKLLKLLIVVVLIIGSSALGLRAQGVYSLTPQPVCWSYDGVDSSLLSLLVFDIRDTIGLFQGYVNAVDGSYVNTSAGGTVSAGYCCCEGSGGSGSTVTITDNDDGTYTAIVGTDTTIIYTKADSLYTTTSISLGDTTYLANSVVQDILIALSQEVNNLRSETGCELEITQSSHGFTAGDLITQDPNTGAYSAAAADTSINFPVAYVCAVIDANTFRVDTEGWVTGSHGETVYRDYFLQDTAGDTDTTSGSFPIFAYRTFSPTLRYYDIPEYIADGAAGGGGATVTASNGLTDQDAGGDVDVELGGFMERSTTIDGKSVNLTWDTLRRFDVLNLTNGATYQTYQFEDPTRRQATFLLGNSNTYMQIEWQAEDKFSKVEVNQSGEVILMAADFTQDTVLRITLEKEYMQIEGIPDYASDAAADGDAGLPSGGTYTVYAEDRTLRIKP